MPIADWYIYKIKLKIDFGFKYKKPLIKFIEPN